MDLDQIVLFWTSVSFLGYWKFIAILTLLIMAALYRWGSRRDALLFGASLLLAESITFLAKIFFRHPRPLDGLVPADDPYSFPSGHAMIAVAFYGMVATLILRRWPQKKWLRVGVVSALGALVMLLGASRIILGVHYPEDVLLGYAFGAVFWVIFYSATRYT